jgi:hypothetical protein
VGVRRGHPLGRVREKGEEVVGPHGGFRPKRLGRKGKVLPFSDFQFKQILNEFKLFKINLKSRAHINTKNT